MGVELSLVIIKRPALSAKERKSLCGKNKKNAHIVEMVRDRRPNMVKLFMCRVPIVKVLDTLLQSTMLPALIVEGAAIWLRKKLLMANAKIVRARASSQKNVHNAMVKVAIHVRLVKAMVIFEKNVPGAMGLA